MENSVVDEGTVKASEPFVGQWRRLVSTSNWDKGKIIHHWRTALIESGAAATEYSDETWSQAVGGVTSQHVGRLRRVFDRFGDSADQYENLFWSHFQAALDWDDAEMWLEGASNHGWSVSIMRRQRWENLGAIAGDEPKDEDIVYADMDEDFDEDANAQSDDIAVAERDMADFSGSPVPEGPDFGDEDDEDSHAERSSDVDIHALSDEGPQEKIRPFEHLDDLPNDFAEVLDSFKVSILRHKASEWEDLPLETVLASLDALREMALAPSE